jgi:UDP-N-acetyl-2-amino-2-deoxyglucuronate dehydrogenase
MSDKLKGVVVGLKMGRNHVNAMAVNPDVDLTAVCDLDEEKANEIADGVVESAGDTNPNRPKIYTDYSKMLAEEKPDIVGVATPNRLHAAMTIEAAKAGTKAICCEKPIAVDLDEAREMVMACRENGTKLIVNHQRRLGPDFTWMREQIENGAIGDVYLIRGTCAGDLLSDGTHLIDSTLFVAGDIDWAWVFASYYRADYEAQAEAGREGAVKGDGLTPDTGGGFHKIGGWRFGHPVEDGAFAVIELVNGVRVELLTGDLRVPGRPYHDVEVIGSAGALWRSGDKEEMNLFKRGTSGEWEAMKELPHQPSSDKITLSYARLVELVQQDKPDSEHPLGTPYTMRGFELLMGIYESARTREVIKPPVSQGKYPLAVELGL